MMDYQLPTLQQLFDKVVESEIKQKTDAYFHRLHKVVQEIPATYDNPFGGGDKQTKEDVRRVVDLYEQTIAPSVRYEIGMRLVKALRGY